ncbi:MAG: hypothetical protein H6625_08980 [Bdellovibrionaceae bacterium]|nr:hypothetical protein [Pseudobdellovibrionaceae bacterium]
MEINEFLQKIKNKAAQNKLNRTDIRFTKTIALLKAKGLLRTNQPITARTGARVELRDAIWAGRNVEPRILEVLPAALLHYRANFIGLENIPPKLEEVLKAIRNNAELGPNFEGIEYAKMKSWANAPLRDKRTKPVNEKKQKKTFGFQLKTINKLQELVASGRFKDQTSAIEAAIEKL